MAGPNCCFSAARVEQFSHYHELWRSNSWTPPHNKVQCPYTIELWSTVRPLTTWSVWPWSDLWQDDWPGFYPGEVIFSHPVKLGRGWALLLMNTALHGIESQWMDSFIQSCVLSLKVTIMFLWFTFLPCPVSASSFGLLTEWIEGRFIIASFDTLFPCGLCRLQVSKFWSPLRGRTALNWGVEWWVAMVSHSVWLLKCLGSRYGTTSWLRFTKRARYVSNPEA